MPVHEYFKPLAFLTIIILATVYLFIIFTKDGGKKISDFVNTPLSVLALVLSVFSTYYVFEESKTPNLELDAEFIEAPTSEGTVTKGLGGIYMVSIKNVGDRDGVSPWMSGRFQLDGKIGEDIEVFQMSYIRCTKGNFTEPYFFQRLKPSSLYHGLIGISCANCIESKQWAVDIDTTTHTIQFRRVPANIGMWKTRKPF